MQDQRQRLIDSFVNSIYLYEDKMFLSFNYKDGQKTITFSDIEGSDLITRGAPRKSQVRDTNCYSFFRGLDFFMFARSIAFMTIAFAFTADLPVNTIFLLRKL